MSSPSNVVVVLTHVIDPDVLKLVGAMHHRRFVTDPERMKEVAADAYHRYMHTDRTLKDFFEKMSDAAGWNDGSEGPLVTWGCSGNYVNPEAFLAEVRPFVADLVAAFRYVSATVFFQPHDVEASTWKIDAVHPEGKELAPGEAFSFDVEIGAL